MLAPWEYVAELHIALTYIRCDALCRRPSMPIFIVFGVAPKLTEVDYNNKFAQSNLGTGPRRGSCARRWLA